MPKKDRQVPKKDTVATRMGAALDNPVSTSAPVVSGANITKRPVGRPKVGKSSNPKYRQASVYLKKSTLNSVKKRLVDTETDLSDLVESLLDTWLSK